MAGEPSEAGRLLASPLIIGSIALSNVCDWAATTWVLHLGYAHEVNPVASAVYDAAGPVGVLAVKVVVVAFAGLLLRRLARVPSGERVLIGAGWMLAAIGVLVPAFALAVCTASLLNAVAGY